MPTLSCFISTDKNTWLDVADTPTLSTFVFCGITGATTAAPSVSLINAPPGDFYYVIVTW